MMDVETASAQPVEQVAAALSTSIDEGLPTAEAGARLLSSGPNALRRHGTSAAAVLARQLRNPLLVLLVTAAVVSFATGDRTNALIVLVIVTMSIGLGFFDEYRSERAVEALHDTMRRTTDVTRDGRRRKVDVVDVVEGDLVHLAIGDIVPADLRLVSVEELECGEAVLTGEAAPIAKTATEGTPDSCARMGTVVQTGAASGIVVATGSHTAFGAIATDLASRHPPTAFQVGLAQFSRMLVVVAAALCGAILVMNLFAHHPWLETAMFALAIVVGITPQLLPALVTISLSTGARRLAERRVLVKRLITIEDLGNIHVLFTDKTGTLTDGRITFIGAIGIACSDDELVALALGCSEAVVEDGIVVNANGVDTALWESVLRSDRSPDVPRRRALLPFDHDRMLASAVLALPDGDSLVTKGAPEAVIDRCDDLPGSARATLDRLFAEGERIIAVARKPLEADAPVTKADEHGLHLLGFLRFTDNPKPDAARSIARLRSLGIDVKVVTGDNALVAKHVCDTLAMPPGETLCGAAVDALDDDALLASLDRTRIFARVSPGQKARIIRVQRASAPDVAFLGDGVNDAVAIHEADVGISVQGATEVATDAADIVLLDKDLDVLADGVVEGRRIFANTIKYVLMATSSNFGNMFSAAGVSAFLKFLPMLPSQVLLNNLVYDLGQMTIPTDTVDEEQLRRPSAWDIGFVRRFMAVFGPISSLFDFLTFWVLVALLHASATLFRSGWFVESLATQTLVILVIRTRRSPFWRSAPSRPLLAGTAACVVTAVAIPFSPLAHPLGFVGLPIELVAIIVLMVLAYLGLCELGKVIFYRKAPRPLGAITQAVDRHERHIHRRAAPFSTSKGDRPSASG